MRIMTTIRDKIATYGYVDPGHSPYPIYPKELLSFYVIGKQDSELNDREIERGLASLLPKVRTNKNFRLVRFSYDRAADGTHVSGSIRQALNDLSCLNYRIFQRWWTSKGREYMKETIRNYHKRYPEGAKLLDQQFKVTLEKILT